MESNSSTSQVMGENANLGLTLAVRSSLTLRVMITPLSRDEHQKLGREPHANACGSPVCFDASASLTRSVSEDSSAESCRVFHYKNCQEP